MRSTLMTALVLALLSGPLQATEQRSEQSDLLREGKLALLDGRLDAALEALRNLQDRFPDGSYYWESVFFEGQVLVKLRRKEEALHRYRELVRRAPTHPLREQADLSLVELSISLYEDGIEQYVEQAIEALESSREPLRQLAALRLSYVEDRQVAMKAVPVLRQLAGQNDDAELRNQATVALLRIDPELLQETMAAGDSGAERKGILRVVVEEANGERMSLSLPLSLARLVVNALPRAALRELEADGIDAVQMLQQLEKSDAAIEVDAEGIKVRIWIE